MTVSYSAGSVLLLSVILSAWGLQALLFVHFD